MEPIRDIAVRPPNAPSAISKHGTERLSDAEFAELNLLCRQMQAYYPNQEFDDQTIEGYQFDIERLAAQFGLGRMRQVLLDIRIRPGQKFFPHPSEIAEELENLVGKERAKLLKENPWAPCGACQDGWLIVEVDGKRRAARCSCWKSWKARIEAAKAATPTNKREVA
jgi:hypothetical protein